MEPLVEPRPVPAYQDYLTQRHIHAARHRRFIRRHDFIGLLDDPDEWAREEARKELRAIALRRLFPTFATWCPRLFYHVRVRPEHPSITRAALSWLTEQMPRVMWLRKKPT